jgi:hypothetical protein
MEWLAGPWGALAGYERRCGVVFGAEGEVGGGILLESNGLV